MELALGLLAFIAVGSGLVLMLGVWLSGRIEAAWSKPRTSVDPILGAKDRIAIYDTSSGHIRMPNHLKTHAEMVAWMTKELPKLTVGVGDRSQ
jgi:hypothetical protein